MKDPQKRKLSNSPKGANKRQNGGMITKGWIICAGGIFSFPENLSKQPCCNYATERLSYSFGRNCQFKHKAYPKGYRRIDQATICDWMKKTNNVEFASFVSEADRNVKYSPFKPKVSQTSKGTGLNNVAEGTTPTPSTTAQNNSSRVDVNSSSAQNG